AAHRFLDRRLHLAGREWNGQRQRPRRGVETVEVGRQAEDAPVVDPDALEHAIAVQEAMVEYRDLRGLARIPFTVDVDVHGGLWSLTCGVWLLASRSVHFLS